jgi:SAM-dependent methyltransferase
MPSAVRLRIFETMEEYVKILEPNNKGWRVLEIGIDGDPKPGGNFKYFGTGNVYETLDYLERLNPTYVQDIQKTNLEAEKFDLIICSQTLEHVYNPIKAINEIFRLTKKGGYAILDAPFTYPYHPASGYDDYWRMTPALLQTVATKAGFTEVIHDMSNNLLTSILVRRGKCLK